MCDPRDGCLCFCGVFFLKICGSFLSNSESLAAGNTTQYLDVSKNRGTGTPKWMVYNGKPY